MLRDFRIALIFYTRLPVKVKGDIRPEELGKATPYFPYVGFLYGLLTWAVYWASSFFFDFGIAWIVAMGAGFLLTGGFHEDGFGDTCDGLGGGWSSERILEIMKDSRVGTFATLGLWFILSTKWYALRNLSLYFSVQDLMILWLTTQVWSRTWPLYFKTLVPYATANDTSKSKPIGLRKLNPKEWGIALIPAILGLILVWQFDFRFQFFCAVFFPLGVIQFFKAKCKKWIGGYTGDVLGAVQQSCELAILLGFLISWP